MAKRNYTEPSPMLPPRVISHSSPLKARGKSVIRSYISQTDGGQTCWCWAARLVVLIASSLTRQL